MKKLLIIQTSLNPASKTAIVAEEALRQAQENNIDAELLDLRKYDLQLCNGSKIEAYNGDMNTIKEKVEAANAYVLAYPVYNYSLSGVCKNFIDIFSYYMEGKKCGVVQNSYSVRSFTDGYSEVVRSLGLHNHVQIVLPLVHSANEDFEDDTISNTKVKEKISVMLENLAE